MTPIVIDPLVCGRVEASADRTTLCDVYGESLADIGLVPRLSAQRVLRQLRQAADGVKPDGEVFTAASSLFTSAELDGESAEDYVRKVVSGAGLTRSTVRRAMVNIATAIEALPEVTNAELPGTELSEGIGTRWVPCGRVFSAAMASNHPAPHVSWVQALFHGYSVAVRPGARDPFTARRLIAALLQAGLPPDKVAFVPSAHEVVSVLLEHADRGIVYGGDAAVRKWRGSTVETRGPGRSTALVDIEADARVLDHLVESTAFDGGTRCTNLSAVLTRSSVAELAENLSERLAALPTLPAADPSASLLVVGRQRAWEIQRHLDELRQELTDHTARFAPTGPVVELADGSFALRPVVLSTDRCDHPAVGTEMPFPFLVVAPWSEVDGVAPLRNSLVLNLLTQREWLIEQALQEPSVRKVTHGFALPWDSAPGIPHDGNFTQFLLEPKGFVRAPASLV